MKSFKEILATIKTVAVKRAKEKSTWAGILTKGAALVGFSLTGVPVDFIAGLFVTYVGGMLTAANTTKEASK